MPSYAQLQSEVWWGAQYVAPAMQAGLLGPLRAHYGLGPSAIGSAGDNNHLYGRHRSRNWDLNSVYCTNRAYGTQDSRDKQGDGDWYRAVDIGITGETLYAASRRMDTLARSGNCPGLAEWFGTFDGSNVVGWYEGRPSTSDDSHLTHLHVGVWTVAANDAATMQQLFATITGTAQEDDMALTAIQTRDVNGDTILMFPWNGTWRRVPKSDNPWILNNSLTALTLAGVAINAATWPGPYNFSDPATWAWAGFEVKPEGAVTFSPADLAKVAEAAKAGAEAGAPTKAELEDAAFAGSQRAERE